MGQIIIETPTPRSGGVIDGTTVEVARCGDLWIPTGEFMNIEAKSTVVPKGLGDEEMRMEGVSVSAQGGDARIIAGRFKTPQEPNQLPSVNNSTLGMMRRDELELLLRVIVFQQGGQVTMDAYEFTEVKERSMEVFWYVDPFQVKVKLQ